MTIDLQNKKGNICISITISNSQIKVSKMCSSIQVLNKLSNFLNCRVAKLKNCI